MSRRDIDNVTCQGGLRELRNVVSDWYWICSLLEITTTTDHNHWEQLSTGSSLNPSCELILRSVSLISPRALIGTD
jgi:hypothetical protein